MARRTAKELSDLITNLLPDSTTDEALSLLEDVNDSIVEDTEDWRTKYEENDKAWRQRYRDRFMGDTDPQDIDDTDDDPPKKLTYESLFEPVNN